jgi:hypothetical protein
LGFGDAHRGHRSAGLMAKVYKKGNDEHSRAAQ